MAKSQRRTTVAALRSMLGLSVKDFAELIGKSVATVKSLEAGRLTLSEETAVEISSQCGISVAWLLDKDVSAPLVSYLRGTNGRNLPYGKGLFELIQSAKAATGGKYPVFPPAELQAETMFAALSWFPILLSAYQRGEAELARYVLNKHLQEMRGRFGSDDKAAEELSGKAKFVSADGTEYVLGYVEGMPALDIPAGLQITPIVP
jgi:transcriptional regulator with XRE-family HTH domain